MYGTGKFTKLTGTVMVAALLVSCGGDDDASDASETDTATGVEEPPADETDITDDADGSDPDPEPADSDGSDAGDDNADGGDGADDAGDGDRTVDASGIDWATVDLTTIDWANIDLADVDFGATESNPTVDQVSDADIAIIQERMAAQFGSGAATLTIGDNTWELEGFQCAFESSGLLNDGRTLGTNLIDEIDGVRIQMQIDVEADGTAQFTLDDIDDFENPSISYLETTDIEVTVDGNTVRAQGDVADETSENFDVVPMTFEGECGPDSVR
jgi:hypothetical protein